MQGGAITTPRKRGFHDYFVTHLPSSSLHPDSKSVPGPHHRLPRSASQPHTSGYAGPPAAVSHPGISREMTVVRIPLQSAKFHFGISSSRGMRPYNEDMFQAGVIELPAFAKRAPVSLSRTQRQQIIEEGTAAEGVTGDPQCFYFGVFDGHGGSDCSQFLREHLHLYIENAATRLQLQSSLKKQKEFENGTLRRITEANDIPTGQGSQPGPSSPSKISDDGQKASPERQLAQLNQEVIKLQQDLVARWSDMVGGYFKRFKPEHLIIAPGRQRAINRGDDHSLLPLAQDPAKASTLETVLTYAFLKADLDFVSVEARKVDEDIVRSDRALNEDEIFGEASKKAPDPFSRQFLGGSTCSVALISTPTPMPFWNPSSPSTLVTAHVGDTRILLCRTDDGQAVSMTTNHHPSSTGEGNRLRRYAASFVTDSFGEERMGGLANTRAFGDIHSKRLGVSAEPEIRRLELQPAQYSFLTLVSDGISGLLTDQEIVDIIKESKTPEQGAKNLVDYATEVSREGDNATCMVIRLGGWERRIEGGLGSMGTKEVREWRRQEAAEPINRRR
ncbi:MAG: CDP-diacylglycerol-inositol 3-phosphatidyltransferase [Watsoniomyces obsoletus]|nr:MAG: CDP-diacylglycerol-inositol 3-phosphatidyltransferase [Watsoniomyces obsoletus]